MSQIEGSRHGEVCIEQKEARNRVMNLGIHHLSEPIGEKVCALFVA